MTKMISLQEIVSSKIRSIENFPKKGIVFKDITTVVKDREAFSAVISYFENIYKDKDIDYIVGLEARGFIFGAALADRLGCGFVVVRKPGKLPYKTIKVSYELEYGSDVLEIHEDAIEPGKTVVVIDDLLATGGTASAACSLVEKLGAKIDSLAFVLELSFLNGRDNISKDIPINSMIVD